MMGQMRPRKILVMTSAAGLVALAIGLLVLTHTGPAQVVRTTAVQATITIDPDAGEIFAPPPAGVSPSLTAALDVAISS